MQELRKEATIKVEQEVCKECGMNTCMYIHMHTYMCLHLYLCTMFTYNMLTLFDASHVHMANLKFHWVM